MPPKKRDKVPVRRQHSTFKLNLPLPSKSMYDAMKKAVLRRANSGGYPEGLPPADEQYESQKIESSETEQRRAQLEEQIKFQMSLKVVAEEKRAGSTQQQQQAEADALRNAQRQSEGDLYNDEEVRKIDSEVDTLNEQKKELYWLLKLVITEEAKASLKEK